MINSLELQERLVEAEIEEKEKLLEKIRVFSKKLLFLREELHKVIAAGQKPVAYYIQDHSFGVVSRKPGEKNQLKYDVWLLDQDLTPQMLQLLKAAGWKNPSWLQRKRLRLNYVPFSKMERNKSHELYFWL